MRSLNDWLSFLEARHPVEIDLGLERVAEVYKCLGDVRPAPLVITVAGTNGKGSCVALLETLFRAAGLRVGTYTSPHLLKFNERVRIAASDVSDEALCAAFQQVEAVRGEVSLSYFEFTTLAGFYLLNQADLDVAILEVGLGGRLDAVNLVDADLSVITSIDLDHESYLGCSREAVAYEKAAVARRDCPLICGEVDPPANLAGELHRYDCKPLWLGPDFTLRLEDDLMRGEFVSGADHVASYLNLPRSGLPLPSVACAVQAFYCLRERLGVTLADDALAQIVAATGLTGRFQRINYLGREFILDVAHNPAAAQLLAARLQTEGLANCVAVFAMMKDKDIEGVVNALKFSISQWFVADLAYLPRAESAVRLQQLLYNAGAEAKSNASVAAALATALNTSSRGASILVFGSFFTVSATLEWLQDRGVKF